MEKKVKKTKRKRLHTFVEETVCDTRLVKVKQALTGANRGQEGSQSNHKRAGLRIREHSVEDMQQNGKAEYIKSRAYDTE